MPNKWHTFAIVILMARNPNPLPTVTITISTNPQIKAYLAELVPTGLYGKNEADAAERLLAKAIDDLIRDGTLPKRARNRSGTVK